jgi:hypothetical protein
MSKPQPSQELIQKITETLHSNGGRMGNGKLKETLAWSDKDFEWVKTHLIEIGRAKAGRGRGGSLELLEAEKFFTPKNKEEPEAPPQVEEIFNLDVVKQKYKLLPEDVAAFKPGMKVSRLATHLYTTEENAWKYMNHYVVTEIKDNKLMVTPRNVKGAAPIQTNPVRFYVTK